MALKIRLDVTNALRLAGERIRSMEQGVMIELDEGFEGDAESLAIIEQGAVMIRNSPRSRIEIKAFLEAAGLRRATEFGKTVATADRPVAPSRAAIELQHLDLVASRAQLERGRHACETGAEHQHGCAFWIAAQLDWALVIGLRREAQAGHGLVHRSAAGDRTHEGQKIASAWNCLTFVRHGLPRPARCASTDKDWLSRAPAASLQIPGCLRGNSPIDERQSPTAINIIPAK